VLSIEGATWHGDLAPIRELMWEIWMTRVRWRWCHVSCRDNVTCQEDLVHVDENTRRYALFIEVLKVWICMPMNLDC
jgi:hypothetical protein